MLKLIMNIFFLLSTAQVPGLGQDCWWAGRWAEHWATAWAEDGVTGEAGGTGVGGEAAEAGEVSNSMSQSTSLSCLHCNKNPIYVFIFGELRGHSPNFHIHVSVSDLYIPRMGPHISCSRIGRSMWEYINCSQIHECGN